MPRLYRGNPIADPIESPPTFTCRPASRLRIASTNKKKRKTPHIRPRSRRKEEVLEKLIVFVPFCFHTNLRRCMGRREVAAARGRAQGWRRGDLDACVHLVRMEMTSAIRTVRCQPRPLCHGEVVTRKLALVFNDVGRFTVDVFQGRG